MAEVVVLGAGLSGMATGMLLARDGHHVTVLERDAAEPTGDAAQLWAGWERRGVSQFRLPHVMMGRWRMEMEREIPEVIEELERLGGARMAVLDALPPAITGGAREGDADLRLVAARRPVVEGALAAAAACIPWLVVRRGAKVAGLVTGPDVAAGTRHIIGVMTEDGEVIRGDLVVDAMGRRSPLVGMLEAVGARPPAEQYQQMGKAYYHRYFRTHDGRPAPVAPSRAEFESATLLTLPFDNGVYGWTFIVGANDKRLRGLRNVDGWERALTLVPHTAAARAAGEPISDIVVMSGLEDRHRSFVVDDVPVVTGLVAVGDAALCTDPTLGAGSSLGLMHAEVLRDVLREVGVGRPEKLVRRFSDATEAVIGPFRDEVLGYDRHRMAEMQADIAGEHYETDETSRFRRVMALAAAEDPDVLRAGLRVSMLLTTMAETLTVPGVREKLGTLARRMPRYAPGPTRAGLLAAVGGDALEASRAG